MKLIFSEEGIWIRDRDDSLSVAVSKVRGWGCGLFSVKDFSCFDVNLILIFFYRE